MSDRITSDGATPPPAPTVADFAPLCSLLLQQGGELTVILGSNPDDVLRLRVESPPKPRSTDTADIFEQGQLTAQNQADLLNWQQQVTGDVTSFMHALAVHLAAPATDSFDVFNAIRLGSIAVNQSVSTWPVAPRKAIVVESNRESATRPCRDTTDKRSVAPGTFYHSPWDGSLVVCCPSGEYVSVPDGTPSDAPGTCPSLSGGDPSWLSIDKDVHLATIKTNPGAVGIIDSLHPQQFDGPRAALLTIARSVSAP